MIGSGIFLLILAVLFPELAVLWGIGMLAIVVGVILFVAGWLGHAIGGSAGRPARSPPGSPASTGTAGGQPPEPS